MSCPELATEWLYKLYRQPALSYYSDSGMIEAERKWPLAVRYRSGRVVSQVADRTKYNNPRECRGVLLRSFAEGN
jgi:hypothetical protein